MRVGAAGKLPARAAPTAACADVPRSLDTLALARERHPGQRNSLDALCKRYGIDNSHRELHGALLDARILADVYLAMTGGQSLLALDEVAARAGRGAQHAPPPRLLRPAEPLRVIARQRAEERAAHAELLALLLEQPAAAAACWLACSSRRRLA